MLLSKYWIKAFTQSFPEVNPASSPARTVPLVFPRLYFLKWAVILSFSLGSFIKINESENPPRLNVLTGEYTETTVS